MTFVNFNFEKTTFSISFDKNQSLMPDKNHKNVTCENCLSRNSSLFGAFCGEEVNVQLTDDEDEVGYILVHTVTNGCPIATHEGEQLGKYEYQTEAGARKARVPPWRRRAAWRREG